MNIIGLILFSIPFLIMGITLFLTFNYMTACSTEITMYIGISRWVLQSWYALIFFIPPPKLELNKIKVKRLLKTKQ